MKKIIVMLFFLGMLFQSCEKINTDQKFIGTWVAEQDCPNYTGNNFTYNGYFTSKVTAVRKISQTDNGFMAIISDAPFNSTTVWIKNDKIFLKDYEIKSNHPSCAELKVAFSNISAEIKNDTLIETGTYVVYVNSSEVSRSINNTYIARFVKRLVKNTQQIIIITTYSTASVENFKAN